VEHLFKSWRTFAADYRAADQDELNELLAELEKEMLAAAAALEFERAADLRDQLQAIAAVRDGRTARRARRDARRLLPPGGRRARRERPVQETRVRRAPNPWVAVPVLVAALAGGIVGYFVMDASCAPDSCTVSAALVATVVGVAGAAGIGIIAVLALKSLDEGQRPQAVYFMSIDNAKFRRPVVPGDQLRLEVELVRFKGKIVRMAAKSYVGDEMTCEAELMATIADR